MTFPACNSRYPELPNLVEPIHDLLILKQWRHKAKRLQGEFEEIRLRFLERTEGYPNATNATPRVVERVVLIHTIVNDKLLDLTKHWYMLTLDPVLEFARKLRNDIELWLFERTGDVRQQMMVCGSCYA